MAYEETPYSIPEPSPWWLRGSAIFMSMMCIGTVSYTHLTLPTKA